MNISIGFELKPLNMRMEELLSAYFPDSIMYNGNLKNLKCCICKYRSENTQQWFEKPAIL